MSHEYKLHVKVNTVYPKTAAWISILMDDTFQLELYEWDSEIYGDHSNFYDVELLHKPLLMDALSVHVGQKIESDEALISALVSTFQDAHDVINWLRKTGIPLKEHWAYV